MTSISHICSAPFPGSWLSRYARILASGETIPWQELRRYLIAHIAGVAIPLPAPRRPVR